MYYYVCVTGIYFSASWNRSCLGFTPILIEFYNKYRENLAIILVSSDKDQSSFEDYVKDMPWYAVPFSRRDIKVR